MSSTLHPGTGEPRRPPIAWVASGLLFAGAAWAIAALLWAMWTSISDFEHAAWLNTVRQTALGDPFRVLLVVGLWVIAVATASLATIAGYYCWAGYRWTRWFALIALGVAGLTFMMNQWAPWCLLPIGLGAALLWLPASRRFFDEWSAFRHPQRIVRAASDHVFYGPLARYR